MKYKRIPFNYDWEELISQLIDDEEGDGVSLDLDNDILQLKSMKEIPWCEFPDDTPMKKTGMWVKDEGDGFVGYYIVYNGKEIYYTDYMENYNELINESNETYSLTLSTRNGRPLSQYGFYDISEEEVDIIKDMIKEEDVNGLWSYLFDVGYPDVVTIVLNLYDDDDDFLDYDLCDNKGNEVKSGQIRDLYKKVIGENYDKTIVNKEFHPEYQAENLRKSYVYFYLKKNHTLVGSSYESMQHRHENIKAFLNLTQEEYQALLATEMAFHPEVQRLEDKFYRILCMIDTILTDHTHIKHTQSLELLNLCDSMLDSFFQSMENE